MIHAIGTKVKKNSFNIKNGEVSIQKESYAYTKVLIGLA